MDIIFRNKSQSVFGILQNEAYSFEFKLFRTKFMSNSFSLFIFWQVIAFAMKEYGWSLEKTLAYVKERRAVVRPNKAFMAQLETYAGILAAR